MTDFSPLGMQIATKKPRVAVLVDGENVSPAYAEKIISKSLAVGELMVRRVYGNVGNLKKWQTAPGFRIMHSGVGKNATDILLAVEAMSLALTKQVDVLFIVSSDRDFTHVATHLREAGHLVIGMGESKAPEGFRKACFRFEILSEILSEVAAPAVAVPNAPSIEAAQNVPAAAKRAKPVSSVSPKLTELERQVVDLLKASHETAGVIVTDLNILMRKQHKTKISETPEGNWNKYLVARPQLFSCDPRGINARVRLKKGA